MITGHKSNEENKEVDITQSLTSNETTVNINSTKKLPTQFQLLKAFSETELEEITNDFKRPLDELEKTLADYWFRRWTYRVENVLACATNLLYIIFLINTSHEGVEDFIKFFNKETIVPSWVGYSIGISFAILSTLLNMLTFSPLKESYKLTLKSVYDKSFKEKIKEVYSDLDKSTFKTLLHGFILLTNASILLNINLTAGMINIVDIADKLDTLPTPFRWTIIVTVLYFSQKDYGNYMNSNYQNGLKFWRDKSLPWLIKEMRKGQIAIPLQILGQSAASIGLRLLIFYYLIESSAKTLGFWFPMQMVMTSAILHSFCTLYPGTYHFYLDDKLKIKSIFEEQKLNNLSSFKEYMQERKKFILSKQGQCYLIKTEPLIILSIILCATICGWLGWQAGATLHDSLIAPILLSIFISITLGGLFYQAESNRVMHKLILTLENSIQNKDKKPPNIETFCERLFDKAASFINIASSVSVIMSNVGVMGRLFDKSHDSTFYTQISLFLAFLRGLNMLRFNGPKVHNTMNSLVPERFRSRLNTQSRFFATPCKHNIASTDNENAAPTFSNR